MVNLPDLLISKLYLQYSYQRLVCLLNVLYCNVILKAGVINFMPSHLKKVNYEDHTQVGRAFAHVLEPRALIPLRMRAISHQARSSRRIFVSVSLQRSDGRGEGEYRARKEEPARETMFVLSEALPVVPAKLIHHILQAEYIDMSELLRNIGSKKEEGAGRQAR